MKVNCREHRKSMELLSLKQRLGKEGLDPEERKDIHERIKNLEKELGLD
jgi:hypothetical protein